ncbi:hypothetical protein D3C87_94630 [compost metagenome]
MKSGQIKPARSIFTEMKTDISFLLYFESTERARIIASLASFCVNTASGQFDPDLIHDDCSVSFVLDREATTDWYYDWYESSRIIGEKILIGSIQLWITESRDEICFEFWANTSSNGKACLDSTNLRNELFKLARENKGFKVQLDHGNGFVEVLSHI